MATIDADANDVITLLSDRLAEKEREIAILTARLHNANQQIDALTEASEKSDVKEGEVVEPRRRR